MTIFNVASVYWSIVHWVKCNFKKNHHNLKKGEDSWIWDAVNTKSELLMDNFLCFSFRIGCVHFLKAGPLWGEEWPYYHPSRSHSIAVQLYMHRISLNCKTVKLHVNKSIIFVKICKKSQMWKKNRRKTLM